jgi:uncharacterized protein YkwD
MQKAIRSAVLSSAAMLLIAAHSWSSAYAAAGRPPLAAPTVGYTYTVQPADTLWDIAAAHGISVGTLIAANKLTDPGLLRPGQTLWVPAPAPVSTTKSAQPASTGRAAADAAGEESTASAATETATTQTPPTTNPEVRALPPGKEGWPSELLALINESRAAAGLPLLSWSPELTRAAQAHAEDCASRSRGGHTGSDGAPLAVRLERQGITLRWAAENWAYAQSVQHAFALWWNEAEGLDPHRRNILDSKYTEIGIGVASSQRGTYFVADFGG